MSKSACPICAAPTDTRYRPFCSRACANRDLLSWMDERYALPGTPASPEDLSVPDNSGNDDR
ncbi:MAG: DNA gyrase inhibitor YacG [Pseudomonadota bacterium]